MAELAFRGAMGYGAHVVGGRGGRPVFVTNLNGSGAGSLRTALQVETGPRIVVFRVGGLITLSGVIQVNPFVTIAGQTAPAPVGLHRAPLYFLDGEEAIIRHFGSYPGNELPGMNLSERDGFKLENWRGAIFDHVSTMFGTDAAGIQIAGTSEEVSVQRSLVARGLWQDGHPDGMHSMAMSCFQGPTKISLLASMLWGCNARNPRFRSAQKDANHHEPMAVDVAYNVIGAWGSDATVGKGIELDRMGAVPGPEELPLEFNIVNNIFEPAGSDQEAMVFKATLGEDGAKSRFYVKGNRRRDPNDPNGPGISMDDSIEDQTGIKEQLLAKKPLRGGLRSVGKLPWPPSACDQMDRILGDVGCFATLPWETQTALDQHALAEAKQRLRRQLDQVAQLYPHPTNPYPAYLYPTFSAGAAPYPDANSDGIDDRWKALKPSGTLDEFIDELALGQWDPVNGVPIED